MPFLHPPQATRKVDLRVPLLLAGAVWFAGFGALSMWWWLGSWDPRLLGLFDYRSATIGDGLLLPVAAGILLGVVLHPTLPGADNEGPWLVASLALGLSLGSMTQVAWLSDDAPVLNWTLPRPHQFNGPGWYHAAFLVLMSGLMAGLIVTAIRRVRKARRDSPAVVAGLARSPWLAALSATLLGLAGLVALDNGRSLSTSAGASTATALAAATLAGGGALAWGLGRHVRAAAPALLLGSIGAGLTCLVSA